MKIQERLEAYLGKTVSQASNEEIYNGLLTIVQDMAAEKERTDSKKKLYYISAEFLIGKLLSNNMINLGIYQEVKEMLENNGKDICEIEEAEAEPSLGNGGLGRLAACFLDSIATLGLAGDGIGTAPTPAITVTDPDNEPVELSGVIFTPEKAGEYTVTIIATDSWGNSATQTKTNVVTAADGDTGSDTDSGAEGGDAPAEGLPGWAIALIVVGGVVVVAAGVTAGVLISKKKAAADDEDSDAQ